MAMSGGIRKFLPVMIILLGVIILVGLIKLRPEPPKKPSAFPVPLVETFEVPGGVPEIAVTGFGTVRARQRISMISEVSGVVTSKAPKFEPGEHFQAGEILLTIDDTNYRAARENAAAGLAQARLTLARAEEEAAVAQREWQLSGRDTSGHAPSPLVLHEPQLDAARASLTAAEAALARADKDLARCRITTPFVGRVRSSDVDVGQFVGAGTMIGAIYATDVLEVTVPLNDADLAWVHAPTDEAPGSTVVLHAEFGGGNYTWAGRVVRIGAAVDEISRQIPVIIEVENTAGADTRPPLLEGVFITAKILARTSAGAVVIPRELLHPDDTVWVVTSDRRIDIRPVTVARAGVEDVVVTDGIVPGETLCASSLQYVTQGMEIKVADDLPPAGPASGAGGDAQ